MHWGYTTSSKTGCQGNERRDQLLTISKLCLHADLIVVSNTLAGAFCDRQRNERMWDFLRTRFCRIVFIFGVCLLEKILQPLR